MIHSAEASEWPNVITGEDKKEDKREMMEGMGVGRAEKIEKQQRKIKGKKIYLTLISCFLLESFISHCSVSPSRGVTALAGIVTSRSRIRVLHYHISTEKSHIINRIYPHLLCKSTNIQSLWLCLITFLNTTFFSKLTLPGLIYRNVLKLFSLHSI